MRVACALLRAQPAAILYASGSGLFQRRTARLRGSGGGNDGQSCSTSATCNGGTCADDFSDPSSGWPTRASSGWTQGYEDGVYRVTLDQDEWNYVLAAATAAIDVTDVIVEVDLRFASNYAEAGAGVICRALDGDNYYFFEVEDGTVSIVRFLEDEQTFLVDDEPTDAKSSDPDDRDLAPDEGYVDYLTHVSHLRVARSPDGVRFERTNRWRRWPNCWASSNPQFAASNSPKRAKVNNYFLILSFIFLVIKRDIISTTRKTS